MGSHRGFDFSPPDCAALLEVPCTAMGLFFLHGDPCRSIFSVLPYIYRPDTVGINFPRVCGCRTK